MKNKIFIGIAFLGIAAIAAFNVNVNTNTNSEQSLLSLANVEALAGENNSGKKCKQGSDHVNDTEMCSTNPVRYRTRVGTIYSFTKDDAGFLTSGKRGFEGTITSRCASNPNAETVQCTASIVNC
jgi:hypothetical protein